MWSYTSPNAITLNIFQLFIVFVYLYEEVTSATIGKHLNDITRELRDLENEDECFLSNEATKTKLMETLKTVGVYFSNFTKSFGMRISLNRLE